MKKNLCTICKSVCSNDNTLCDNCYKDIQINVNALVGNIKETEDKIDKEYKEFDRYISNFSKLLKLYEKLYHYASIIPNQIDIDPPTFEEYKEIVNQSIENIVNHRTDVYFFQLKKFGDASCLVELELFREELIRTAKCFPMFEKVLSTNRIDNILENYK